MRNILKLKSKTALFLILPLLLGLAFLPRKVDRSSADGSWNYNYTYPTATGGSTSYYREGYYREMQNYGSPYYNYPNYNYSVPSQPAYTTVSSNPPTTTYDCSQTGGCSSYAYPHTQPVQTTIINFTLISDNTSYCVGQAPRYTITAPGNWSNQPVQWISMHNGQETWRNTYNLTHDGSRSYWSESGQVWQESHVGTWKKTAVIGGSTQTITIVVRNCGNTNTTTVTTNPDSTNYYGNCPGCAAGSNYYMDNRGWYCQPPSRSGYYY